MLDWAARLPRASGLLARGTRLGGVAFYHVNGSAVSRRTLPSYKQALGACLHGGRVPRLDGLTYSPLLHATHLTGTVSGLCGLSLERPLSTTNRTANQGNFFPSYFIFLHEHGPVLCLRLVYYIDLFRLTVILFDK